MKPKKLTIKSVSQKYSIIIGPGLVVNISKTMRKNLNNFEKCLLLTKKFLKNLFFL